MNNSSEIPGATGEPSREEILAVLFSNLVMSLCQEAFACLGQMPHPMTGETMQDLERAQFVIGQLEVLLIKTKGNLTPEESEMLKQNVAGLRMAFVEAVENPQASAIPIAGPQSGIPGGAAAELAPAQEPADPRAAMRTETREPVPAPPGRSNSMGVAPAASNANQEEPKKRYTKKY